MEDVANSGLLLDGSLYIFGTTKSFGEPNGDHYLIKLKPDGTVIWEKHFGGTEAEIGKGITALSDGNLMLWGSTRSSGSGKEDIHLIKVDTTGATLWEKAYGGEQYDDPDDLQELPNGRLCIAATTTSYGAGSKDMFVLWLDQQGNELRSRTFGGPDLDGCTKLLAIENNEIMLHGYTKNFGAISRDLYLMRLSEQGDSLWAKRIGSDEYEQAEDMVRTTEGGYLFSSHSAKLDPDHNMFAFKLDPEGNMLWEKHLGGDMHDGGEALLINEAGNYVFVGRSMSFGTGDRNIYLVTTNPSGETLATDTLGGAMSDWAEDIIAYKEFYFLIGHSNSYGEENGDVYVEKYLP